jgi:hypothetical protein
MWHLQARAEVTNQSPEGASYAGLGEWGLGGILRFSLRVLVLSYEPTWDGVSHLRAPLSTLL